LVDEFQDTNWAQYELVKMLAGRERNLAVVGDDDQSVYAFRGASMSNILQFKKDYPEAKQVVLVENYRNKQNILDLAYEFIKLNNPNRLEYQLKGAREGKGGARGQRGRDGEGALNKKLIAREKGKGEIEVIRGDDLGDEIRRVVEKIADLKIKDKKSSWGDFAILVRANESAKEFCAALETAGLPYMFFSSRGLYAKPVVMDIIAYLRLLDNYHESAALYRVLNLPVFGFSCKELVDLNHQAQKKARSLFGILNDSSAFARGELKEKIGKVLSLIEKHSALARTKPASEVMLAFLRDSGYLKFLTGQGERQSRETATYLNQFMKRIKSFEAASDDKTVKAFLEELNMEIKAGEQGALAPDIEAGPDTVKVMTVHAAKGLEFKYVFIVGMVDKRFPAVERKETIAVPDALVKEILPEGDTHLEEERRLFYVAMTRARQGLYFSWAEDYGGARAKKPSRFLAEVGLVHNEAEKKSKFKIQNNKSQINSKFKTINSQFFRLSGTPSKRREILNSSASAEPRQSGGKFSIPSHFSYSQLAAFSSCPYQYRFAHILKIPTRGKASFSFGKTMHLTLQKLFELVNEKKGLGQADLFSRGERPFAPTVSMDEVLSLYERSWIDDWYESKKQKEEYKKKGKEILREFYEKHKDNWPNAVMIEKKFNIKIKDGGEIYSVRGTIDRIDKEGEEIRIVDYKTGSPKDKLSFADKEQLLLYQIAAGDLFREKVGSLVFYYLENNSEVEFSGSDKDLEKVKEKIVGAIKEIKKGEFPPKPSQLCRWCDFFEICEFRKN